MKKQFNELTDAGKKARLAKYEKEREARGTKQTLARIVATPKIKDIANGNKQAVIRLAVNKAGSKEAEFPVVTAFIKKGKDGLENYYANLQKGQLVSVEYKEANGYKNVYNMINRNTQPKAEVSAQPLEA